MQFIINTEKDLLASKELDYLLTKIKEENY